MSHHRKQSDSKSTTSRTHSLSSMPTGNHVQSTLPSQSSTTHRVSIYSMREKVILNKMTKMLGKLAPNTETEVTSRFHQEIPAIAVDGHLMYCFYTTIQNLFHLNAVYILLYHAVFWLDSLESPDGTFQLIEKIEKTEYEQTLFVTSLNNSNNHFVRPIVNIHLINKYIYLTLIGVSLIEFIEAVLWILQKKLAFLIQRSQKWRNRLGLLFIGIILILYLAFLTWLFFHTFTTHDLPLPMFFTILIHFVLLMLLDKPNLFRRLSIDLLKESFPTTSLNRKQHCHSTSSSSISSATMVSPVNRLLYRLPTLNQLRKINSSFSSVILSSRWSSVMEQKLDRHECSTVYEQTRQEADDLRRMVLRRMALQFYRPIASLILFDLLPYMMMDPNSRSIDHHRYVILVLIFAFSAFLTHSIFLFPVKFLTNLQRLATHLGQWRLQSVIRTDAINEWSSECNSYTRGSIIKLSSDDGKSFIAIQHLSNAAHPQSISHSFLYRFFGDARYILRIQFLICLILIFGQLFWIICERYWYEILISIFIILNSSYTVFKIIRNRLVFDLIDDNESNEILSTSKGRKSNKIHLT